MKQKKKGSVALVLALLLLGLLGGCGGEIVYEDSPVQAVLTEREEPQENVLQEKGAQTDDGQGEASPSDRILSEGNGPGENGSNGSSQESLDENGWYDSKEEVALYIYLYDRLPDNYVTKREAENAGWSGGDVERYTGEGTAIGGSYFGNYEGNLPVAAGRTYTECDIDTVGSFTRGAKRIVFSNDGLIYYTEDHYETFELLYGEP